MESVLESRKRKEKALKWKTHGEFEEEWWSNIFKRTNWREGGSEKEAGEIGRD